MGAIKKLIGTQIHNKTRNIKMGAIKKQIKKQST